MPSRGAMSPGPDRAPDAARRYDANRREIPEEAKATSRVIRPEVNPHAKRDGQQQPEKDSERARRPLLLEIVSAHRRGWPLRGTALRREQRFVRDRLQLSIDLRQLFRPVALGHRQA